MHCANHLIHVSIQNQEEVSDMAANGWLHRFCWGLGMHLVAKSDQSTSNPICASYAVQSNDLVRHTSRLYNEHTHPVQSV
jgi:hypothetical protein